MNKSEGISMTKITNCARALVLVGATSLLAACGGGGGGNSAAAPAVGNVSGTGVPVGATLTIAGLLEFAQSLIASTNEVDDPVVLGNATFPTSETE